jgi:CRP-like cAMP-binding protein
MALERDALLLRDVPILSAFDTEALRIIAFTADRRVWPAGMVLFRKGERSDGGHLVVSGDIDLDAADGRLPVRAGPGTLIGETAMFVETERPATATVVAKAETIRITRQLMSRILGEYPGTAELVRRTLAERLDAARQTLASVEARLIG